jgi:ArsR family transcriptional regulator, arsenate/arsenite/antimonite-responsive transcriptional repressor
MAQAKYTLFDNDLQQCAELYKALGHPARLAILKYLAETKTCITGDISDKLPLSRTTVTQHLTELKNVGLIQGNIDGTKTYYCLNPETLSKLKALSDGFLTNVCCEINCCKPE